jgi:hypothetical protein
VCYASARYFPFGTALRIWHMPGTLAISAFIEAVRSSNAPFLDSLREKLYALVERLSMYLFPHLFAHFYYFVDFNVFFFLCLIVMLDSFYVSLLILRQSGMHA